jgi:hypothetical protein
MSERRRTARHGGGTAAALGWWASWSELVVWRLLVCLSASTAQYLQSVHPLQPSNLVSLRRLNLSPCQVQVGVTAVHGEPPHPPPPTDVRLRVFSGETQTREARLGTSPAFFSQCGRALRSSGRTRLQDIESSATHTSCPCCTQRASLCRRAVRPRRLPQDIASLWNGTYHRSMYAS